MESRHHRSNSRPWPAVPSGRTHPGDFLGVILLHLHDHRRKRDDVGSSSTRIVRTPWLERPTRRISLAGTRITMPLEDHEHVLFLRPDERAGEQTGLLRELVTDDALAAAPFTG